MPHGYSVREATNENEVYSDLVAATRGHRGAARFARRVGLTPEYIHGMLDGNRRVSAQVAKSLGWELRWVKPKRPQVVKK